MQHIQFHMLCFSFFKIERLILVMVISFCSLQLYAQENKILKTDSSIITIRYFSYLNSMREFNELNDRDKSYYKEYTLDTKVLQKQGLFENGDCVGIWNFYSADGTLEKQINYSTGEKIYLNDQTEMYDSIFVLIRKHADSIVISNFGFSFFKKHIAWNCSNSYYYGEGMSNKWFDASYVKPTRFLFRYYIAFDANHKYSSIEFQLDSLGALIQTREILGLKNCKSNCVFNISYDQAIELAKLHGMEIKKSHPYFSLKWIKPSISTDFEGDYEIEIIKRTRSVFHKTYTDEIVLIDPWNGEFKSRTKTKVRHVREFRHRDFPYW